MWNYILTDGNPKKEGRYLIAYRHKGTTNLKYFIGDFVCFGIGCAWNVGLINDIEIIAWQEIEPFVLPVD